MITFIHKIYFVEQRKFFRNINKCVSIEWDSNQWCNKVITKFHFWLNIFVVSLCYIYLIINRIFTISRMEVPLFFSSVLRLFSVFHIFPPLIVYSYLFRVHERISLYSRLVSFPFSPREIENAARKASGEMVALCVSNLCHTVLCAPLRATISQEWLLPLNSLLTLQSPFPTYPPLPFSPTRKIIATALRITRSYLRPVRL